VEAAGERYRAQAVLSTVAPVPLLGLADFPADYAARLRSIAYQGTVCALFSLKRSLGPIYWMNIQSRRLPFGVLIEHTNFYRHPAYDGHLVYAAAYVQERTDPIWERSDEEVVGAYLAGLRDQFGIREEEVNWWRLIRLQDSAPIYRTGFLENVPPAETPTRNLFLAGMLRSYPERSINDSIRQGLSVGRTIISRLGDPASGGGRTDEN
jgi:protoporphyrinogen oxidase